MDEATLLKANPMRLAAAIHTVCVPMAEDGQLLPGISNRLALHAVFFLADAMQVAEYGRPSYGEIWVRTGRPMLDVRGLHLNALIKMSAPIPPGEGWSPYRLSIDDGTLEAVGSYHTRMDLRVQLRGRLSEVEVTCVQAVVARLRGLQDIFATVRESPLFGGDAPRGDRVQWKDGLPPHFTEEQIDDTLFGIFHAHY